MAKMRIELTTVEKAVKDAMKVLDRLNYSWHLDPVITLDDDTITIELYKETTLVASITVNKSGNITQMLLPYNTIQIALEE